MQVIDVIFALTLKISVSFSSELWTLGAGLTLTAYVFWTVMYISKISVGTTYWLVQQIYREACPCPSECGLYSALSWGGDRDRAQQPPPAPAVPHLSVSPRRGTALPKGSQVTSNTCHMSRILGCVPARAQLPSPPQGGVHVPG